MVMRPGTKNQFFKHLSNMLGNELEILDYKFEDDTTLSLWTNQKVRK